MTGIGVTHAKYWEAIRAKGAGKAAADAGCREAAGAVVVPLAGAEISVHPAARKISGPDGAPAGFLESIVAVTYLAMADGRPLSGQWVSEKMLPLGDVYFRGSHSIPFGIILDRFSCDPDAFRAALGAVGGSPDAFGDFGARIPALPMVPMRVGIWGRDDEFPAEGRVLFDSTATDYLMLDGILTLAGIVFRRLAGA